jgi:hypothetical protein
VDVGVAVDWDPGRLQADNPRFKMRTAIQTRFLIDSSFFVRIVTGRLNDDNSPSVFFFRLTDFLMKVSSNYDKMDYRTFILIQANLTVLWTRGADHEQKGNGLRWDAEGWLYFRKQ